MSARAALAAALAGVEGVRPHTHPPDVVTVGDAWPVWVSASPLNDCALDSLWDVYATVGGADLATTIDTGDALLGALIEAISNVGAVEIAEPVLVELETGAHMPALRVRVTLSANP